MVHFVILTRDEVHNLAPALASISGLGPALVVDSFSTDGTQELAKALGATLVENEWQGYSNQRNYALSMIPEGEWVFFLDADERVDPTLSAALRDFDRSRTTAYAVRRLNLFLGRPIPHAGRYPDRQVRLFQQGSAVFENRTVHERVITELEVSELAGHLVHDSANTLRSMLDKHTGYAELEALAVLGSRVGTRWLFSSDPQRRRRWLKEQVWLRLPCRPTIRMVWLLLIRGGIRDGRAGIAYAKMLAAYEQHVDCFLLATRMDAAARARAVDPASN